MEIEGIKVYINYIDKDNSFEVSENEIKAYINRGQEQSEGKVLTSLDITVDGEEVILGYHYHHAFERIRRITGYLVGTTDRWNNAKKAELKDRVKHN